jgi:FkbM family methyltransferase
MRWPGWLLARLYERRLHPVLRGALAGRSGTFVDVGAHVGAFLLKVRRIRPDLPYVGFEPNPHAFRILAARAEEMPHARALQVALGEEEGMATLHRRGSGADPEASLVPGFRDPSFYRSSLSVKVVPGDRQLADLGVERVAMVKVDVEGAELEVLRGLRATLSRERPAILCELLPPFEGDTPLSLSRIGRQRELHALLRALAYQVGVIDRDGRVREGKLEPHSDVRRCDYLFVPAERWEPDAPGIRMQGEGGS